MAWFFAAAGAFSLLASVLNWQFFMNHRKARFISRLLGPTGTRVFYALLGLLLIVLGALALVGIVDLSSESA